MKGDSKKELNIFERFVSGSLAGVLSQTAIYPLEVHIIFCFSKPDIEFSLTEVFPARTFTVTRSGP